MKYLILLLLTSCATQTCKGVWYTDARGDSWCEQPNVQSIYETEGCKKTMRDMYVRAGIKQVDEMSLQQFCARKFK